MMPGFGIYLMEFKNKMLTASEIISLYESKNLLITITLPKDASVDGLENTVERGLSSPLTVTNKEIEQSGDSVKIMMMAASVSDDVATIKSDIESALSSMELSGTVTVDEQ